MEALTFLSNSFNKLSSKRWKWQHTKEIPKFDIHRLRVILQVFDTWWMQCHDHESNVFWVFIYILIWLWVCFAKRAMFWCEFRWVLSLLYPLLSLKSCRKIFFVFLLIFPLFAVSSNKTNLLRIYLEYLGKKKTNKQTNRRTNKAKPKAANSVYFSSITLRITPQFSVYLCLLFFFFFFFI